MLKPVLILILSIFHTQAGAINKLRYSSYNDQPDQPKTWIWDPKSGLCAPLMCRQDEVCLLDGPYTAVCVDRQQLHKNGDRVISLRLALDEHVVEPDAWLSEQVDIVEHGYQDEVADSTADDDDDDDEMENSDDYYYYDDEHDDDDADDNDDEHYQEDTDDDDDDDDDEYDDDGSDWDSDEYEDDNEEDETSDDTEKSNYEDNITPNDCVSCPYESPDSAPYVCASDNRTYTSFCRLTLHNCLHGSQEYVTCHGFCPCQDSSPPKTNGKQDMSQTGSLTSVKSYMTASLAEKLRDEDSKHQQIRHNTKKQQYGMKILKNKLKSNGVSKDSFGDDSNNDDDVKCSQKELNSMGTRLLDWFTVIKQSGSLQITQKTRHTPAEQLPKACKSEAVWMWRHLNANRDNQLDLTELRTIEGGSSERCVKQYLDKCDVSGDERLSGHEWCMCFAQTLRPCEARRQQVVHLLGAYIPSCDSVGYYQPVQCHHASGYCWCSDRHGLEIPTTRVRHQQPPCPSNPNSFDDDDDDDDEDNTEGSGSVE